MVAFEARLDNEHKTFERGHVLGFRGTFSFFSI